MHIEDAKKKQFLFDDEIKGSIPDDADELNEASRLLHGLIHESTQYAYNALEVEVNGSYKGITSIYNDCVSMIRRVSEGGEKTAFLSMSVLEDTFQKVLPLLLVHLESILDGSSHMIEDTRRLQEILQNNPYKMEWKNRAEEYKKIIASVGLSPDDADYSDLTKIMDPLMDALTFYGRVPRLNKPKVFRLGAPGRKDAPPAFSIHVPVFHSESDMVWSMYACGKENAVMFAGLELTYGETDDLFNAWYTGYENERMHNIMRYEKLSREEYMAAPDPWSRKIYLCVKSGGEIYLITMPYQRESYGGARFDDKTKYCYGHRASYAPYQAFYDEPPAAPEDTKFLAVPRKGYSLAEIMDPDQKAWLPVFLNETFHFFFKSGPVDAIDAYLPHERALVAPSGDELYRNPAPENALAVVKTGLAAVRLHKEIPEPADLFEEPYMKTLIEEFHVGIPDLAEHGECILHGQALNDINLDDRLRSATLRLVCERVQTCLGNKADANWQIAEHLKDKQAIFRRVLSGACGEFTTLTVHGEPRGDNAGKTSISDGRTQSGQTAMWYGNATRSSPPVLLEVRPVSSEDYAILLGIPVDKLPNPVRLYTELDMLWRNYQNAMPRSMSYNRTVEPKPLIRLNLCMTKTEYKKALKSMSEKGEKHD